jgi:hypothetical protein
VIDVKRGSPQCVRSSFSPIVPATSPASSPEGYHGGPEVCIWRETAMAAPASNVRSSAYSGSRMSRAGPPFMDPTRTSADVPGQLAIC